jgi:hypothetical protein
MEELIAIEEKRLNNYNERSNIYHSALEHFPE